jgi:hypothetical protein
VEVSRAIVSYDEDEQYLGTSLDEEFNRTDDRLRLKARYKLTPFTTFVMDGELERDRFTYSPIRDSNSLRVVPGVEFGRFALVTGSARVGYRRFRSPAESIPMFEGVVAAVDLSYVLMNNTRFTVHTERDIEYSFDPAEAYYVQSGFSGTLTQKITNRWDVQGTGGQYRLRYPEPGTAVLTIARTDYVNTVGGGVGYTVGPNTRVGLDLFHYSRTSSVSSEYNGMRFGLSVTYGL